MKIFSLLLLIFLNTGFSQSLLFHGKQDTITFQENDLIKLRTLRSIHMQKPGITGLAQVNGRDSLSIEQKVEEETYYLKNKSLRLNVYILFLTIFKIFKTEDISH